MTHRLSKPQLDKRKKRRLRNKPPKLVVRRYLTKIRKEYNHAA